MSQRVMCAVCAVGATLVLFAWTMFWAWVLAWAGVRP